MGTGKFFRFAAVLMLVPLIMSAHPVIQAKATRFNFNSNSRVLDGDTLIVNGRVAKISGIDAPELGPWAKCWAEAALAGHAKGYVETTLSDGRWDVVDLNRSDDLGARLVRIVRSSDDEDLSDLLVVYGYAAKSPKRWDWCGSSAHLHQPEQGESQPHGPSLWWPTGRMFDLRAAD
jgi:endonuclease YncB( thermonuclease family)